MNISMLHYYDLIESISAGQYWIQATFNLTVTTGFILGDYVYPSSLLGVMKQAGITHLVIHHTASNSPFYDSINPLRHLYSEGGMNSDGSQSIPSVYAWNNSPSSSSSLLISHSYQYHSNLLANLINIRCHATEKQFVTFSFSHVGRRMSTFGQRS